MRSREIARESFLGGKNNLSALLPHRTMDKELHLLGQLDSALGQVRFQLEFEGGRRQWGGVIGLIEGIRSGWIRLPDQVAPISVLSEHQVQQLLLDDDLLDILQVWGYWYTVLRVRVGTRYMFGEMKHDFYRVWSKSCTSLGIMPLHSPPSLTTILDWKPWDQNGFPAPFMTKNILYDAPQNQAKAYSKPKNAIAPAGGVENNLPNDDKDAHKYGERSLENSEGSEGKQHLPVLDPGEPGLLGNGFAPLLSSAHDQSPLVPLSPRPVPRRFSKKSPKTFSDASICQSIWKHTPPGSSIVKQNQQGPRELDWSSRLWLLSHALKCASPSCRVHDGRAYCPSLKALLENHALTCSAPWCKVASCLYTRQALIHYHECRNGNCPVCRSVGQLEFLRVVAAQVATNEKEESHSYASVVKQSPPCASKNK